MIRFRFDNQPLLGEIVEELPEGRLKVLSHEYGMRTRPGGHVIIKTTDVLARDVPDKPRANQAEIEAAMAKERETIPSIESILKPLQQAAAPIRKAEANKVANG